MQASSPSVYKLCTLVVDRDEESEQHHQEEDTTEEEEEEEEAEEDEELYDDPNDADYVPEYIEPRPRRKPGRFSSPVSRIFHVIL